MSLTASLSKMFTLVGVLIIFTTKHCCANTMGGVQVIVINSNYNGSSVNTANNFDGILHGLTNAAESGGSRTTSASTSTGTNKQTGLISQAQYNTYFGTAFSPYVRNDGFRKNGYTNENIEEMLTVIQTKCHSVLTFEMGYYATPFYFGPYDATSASKVASVAALMNARRNTSMLTVSQGAYITITSAITPRFPDLDAAFYSAEKANRIYPGTVSSITVFIQDPTALAAIGLTQNTAYYANFLLRQYSSQAHSQNLRLGVVVGFCDQILDTNEINVGKQLLLGLAQVTDYIICEIYPSSLSSIVGADEYNFDNVKLTFESVKLAFSRSFPNLEIILFTGFPSSELYGGSIFHTYSPLKIKNFWDSTERWSRENHQKVYVYQAFDTFETPEIGYGNKQILTGYWAWTQGGRYMVKATQEVVSV